MLTFITFTVFGYILCTIYIIIKFYSSEYKQKQNSLSKKGNKIVKFAESVLGFCITHGFVLFMILFALLFIAVLNYFPDSTSYLGSAIIEAYDFEYDQRFSLGILGIVFGSFLRVLQSKIGDYDGDKSLDTFFKFKYAASFSALVTLTAIFLASYKDLSGRIKSFEAGPFSVEFNSDTSADQSSQTQLSQGGRLRSRAGEVALKKAKLNQWLSSILILEEWIKSDYNYQNFISNYDSKKSALDLGYASVFFRFSHVFVTPIYHCIIDYVKLDKNPDNLRDSISRIIVALQSRNFHKDQKQVYLAFIQSLSSFVNEIELKARERGLSKGLSGKCIGMKAIANAEHVRVRNDQIDVKFLFESSIEKTAINHTYLKLFGPNTEEVFATKGRFGSYPYLAIFEALLLLVSNRSDEALQVVSKWIDGHNSGGGKFLPSWYYMRMGFIFVYVLRDTDNVHLQNEFTRRLAKQLGSAIEATKQITSTGSWLSACSGLGKGKARSLYERRLIFSYMALLNNVYYANSRERNRIFVVDLEKMKAVLTNSLECFADFLGNNRPLYMAAFLDTYASSIIEAVRQMRTTDPTNRQRRVTLLLEARRSLEHGLTLLQNRSYAAVIDSIPVEQRWQKATLNTFHEIGVRRALNQRLDLVVELIRRSN